MKVERIWGLASKNTFSIAPIKQLIHEEIYQIIGAGGVVVDPFSNGVRFSENSIINDLNPEIDADFHMDALDFLKQFKDESVDVVLYDSPYSLRQVVECYKGYGKEVTKESTQASWRAKHLDEIQRILKINGKALCFGWNSNGVGKKRGFEMERVLLVPHGGSKYDTICTVETKRFNQMKLF